jgi:hypothetical protein
VPSSSGGFLPADPIKFCLRFKPPTIALVYSIKHASKGVRKYVHEIRVDAVPQNPQELPKLCDDLFAREKTYLNPAKISKQQVTIAISYLTTS